MRIGFTSALCALMLATACSSGTKQQAAGQDAGSKAADGGGGDASIKDGGGADGSGKPSDGGGTGADGQVADTGTANADDGGTSACPGSFQDARTVPSNGTVTMDAFADATKSVCYYKFTGKKNQALGILAHAKPAAGPFDATYPDTVITLYDASQKKLATDDEPYPQYSNDSQLYTLLPADGTYYLTVQECNSIFTGKCNDPARLQHLGFGVAVGHLSFASGSGATLEGAEPNDDGAHATPLDFSLPAKPAARDQMLLGGFSGASDVDVYSFTLPSDLAITAGTRAKATVYVQPSGASGNGSTSAGAKVWLVDSSAPSVIIASQDAAVTGVTLSAPITANATYWLYAQHPSSAAGGNDFYFLRQYLQSSAPLENEPNNTVVAAETLAASASSASTFRVAGDLSSVSDVDYFKISTVTGVTQVLVNCTSQRDGSGVRGLEVTVLASDLTTVLGTATESASVAAQTTWLAAAAFPIYFKVEATSFDANVAGRAWNCGVLFR